MNGIDVLITVLVLVFLFCCWTAYDKQKDLDEQQRLRDEFYASKRMAARIMEYDQRTQTDEFIDRVRDAA